MSIFKKLFGGKDENTPVTEPIEEVVSEEKEVEQKEGVGTIIQPEPETSQETFGEAKEGQAKEAIQQLEKDAEDVAS